MEIEELSELDPDLCIDCSRVAIWYECDMCGSPMCGQCYQENGGICSDCVDRKADHGVDTVTFSLLTGTGNVWYNETVVPLWRGMLHVQLPKNTQTPVFSGGRCLLLSWVRNRRRHGHLKGQEFFVISVT